jgi:tRNA modification GTPase
MLSPHDEYPIAALASGSGPGAIGVIRISGQNCWNHVAHLLPSSKLPTEREACLRTFRDQNNHENIDDVILTFFKGPKSFTGQDTIELSCHGGPYIIQRILTALYQNGIRPAAPGEFTKRALLNGKLDLTAAEGIKDLVEAQSRQQWIAGRQLISGKLKNEINHLRLEVIQVMAYLEAMIDFPDEGDTSHIKMSHVLTKLTPVEKTLSKLSSTFNSGKIASQGLRVGLTGAPNAGKSTLLNTLLDKNRAIVSDIAGTTRDYIEESCLIDGRLIRLIDTAGIRDTTDPIEAEGIRSAREILESVDAIIALEPVDESVENQNYMRDFLKSMKGPVIWIRTKADLNENNQNMNQFSISAKTGAGIESLKAQLKSLVDHHTGSLDEHPFLTSQRQTSAILSAQVALEQFNRQINLNAGPEILAFELQAAVKSLGSVIGDVSSEDILDKIFSEFCIGK